MVSDPNFRLGLLRRRRAALPASDRVVGSPGIVPDGVFELDDREVQGEKLADPGGGDSIHAKYRHSAGFLFAPHDSRHDFVRRDRAEAVDRVPNREPSSRPKASET